MSYTINAYQVSKRINSTATPSGGTPFAVSLKDGSGILSPSFLLNTSDFSYNYVSFNGRYYWVKEITWVRENLVRVDCEVDVLASWKSNILATQAYVNYSSSHYNAMIPDNRLMKEADGSITTWIGDQLSFIDDSGSYVMGVIGKPSAPSVSGMCTVYSLTARQCSDLAVVFSDSGDIFAEMKEQFGDVFSCLVFCRWIPISVDSGSSATVFFGSYNTGVSGVQMVNRYVTNTFQAVIPWSTSDFRSVEPYSTGYLFLPYVGVVDLQLNAIRESSTLLIRCVIDKYTGDIVYKIGGESNPLAVYTGNCAVEIPISSYQRDWKGVAQNGVSTLLSFASDMTNAIAASTTKGAAGGSSTAGMGTLSNFANMVFSYLTFNSGLKGGFTGGCGSGMGWKPEVTIVRHDTSQSPSTMGPLNGRPCGKTLTMSSLSGYVQTADFKVSGPMTGAEKVQIESLMMGGVYIE